MAAIPLLLFKAPLFFQLLCSYLQSSNPRWQEKIAPNARVHQMAVNGGRVRKKVEKVVKRRLRPLDRREEEGDNEENRRAVGAVGAHTPDTPLHVLGNVRSRRHRA